MHKKYVIAKYLRLSSDDGNFGESNSISNQRDLLDEYIRNNFEISDISCVELIDDGYSGTNFDRPSVKRLLALAESKQINCIIVKDFSRFGRDYIEVGGYLEEKLPCWQVRFISVNDNYDSNNYRGITSGIETALKNVAYTLYSRDLSEKVKSAQKIRKKKGEFLSPFAFYGYIKDPSNKNRIIVDEEAAPVVQRIFEMRASGISSKQIAITLNNEGVLTPAMYKANKDPECRRWNTVSEYNYWSAGNVDILLSNERYTGKMISGKMKRITVGSGKVKAVSKDDWIVVENTHEAIISAQLFEKVKELRSNYRNEKRISNVSFKGILRCGSCKHILTRYGRQNKKVKYYCEYKDYTNSNECFQNSICETDIEDLLLKVIKSQVSKALDLEKILYQKRKKSKCESENVNDLQRKVDELKEKRLSTYKDFTKGKLNETQFVEVRNEINSSIVEIEKKLNEQSAKSSDDNTFIDCFKKHVGIECLDNNIVNSLIKTIYVHNDNRIEIVWNFADYIPSIVCVPDVV